ncbi:Oidioi.mRNA.OKI2018_I69.chr2.g5571.t1.cds [Oikopleura dioica]|uniref:Oidioi.mRNA.OKI2018_I69.chr2.g5571.t1.cds n=1 Tax=Oikopleura dioica TaxID=34765 RepID=A0ABN7T7A9_OIKDI|nr:Oidioi.mRNA.OKI2018_I69.chr2.g5571.t1.cds [Oikopleura dioica]
MTLLVSHSFARAEFQLCPSICDCRELENGGLEALCIDQEITDLSELSEIANDVTELNLSNNFISSLNGVSQFFKLERLVLRNNTMEIISDDFRDMPFLKEVDFSFNERLKSVGDFAFFSLPSLERLSFADCSRLQWFGHRSVYDSYSLKEIDFSFTKLQALSQHLTTYSPSLRSILFDGVELSCSCLNTWMLDSKFVFDISEETERCLRKARKAGNICGPILIPSDDVAVEEGDEFAIRCLAMGEPTVTVRLLDQDENVVGSRGELRIKNAKKQHAGKYTCQAANQYDLIRDSFQVRVAEPTPFSSEHLEFTLDSIDFSYDSNSDSYSDSYEDILSEELDRSSRYGGVSYEWETKSCPEGCICTINTVSSRKIVTCAGAHLDNVPLPSDMNVLIARQSNLDLGKMNLYRNMIRNLRIQESEYPSIDNEDFDDFVNLEDLSIIEAGLTEISETAFDDLEKLRYLDLSGNELARIPVKVFQSLENLELLSLANNPLQIIEYKLFSPMENLKTLNVGNCDLDDFPASLTSSSSLLEFLWLDANNLVDVPDFSKLKSIREIRLTKNPIQYFKFNDFHDLPELNTIIADEMPWLEFVEEAAFRNLPKLTEVSISDSPTLSFFHQNAFENTPELRILSLRRTGLISLGNLNLPTIHTLNIDSNEFYCTCALEWIEALNLKTTAKCRASNQYLVEYFKQAKNREEKKCEEHLFLSNKGHSVRQEDDTVRLVCYSTLNSPVTLSGVNSKIKEKNIFEFDVSKETVGTYYCRSGVSEKEESIKIIMDGYPEYSEEEETPRALEVKTASASPLQAAILVLFVIFLL